jgi:hypothetical protein
MHLKSLKAVPEGIATCQHIVQRVFIGAKKATTARHYVETLTCLINQPRWLWLKMNWPSFRPNFSTRSGAGQKVCLTNNVCFLVCSSGDDHYRLSQKVGPKSIGKLFVVVLWLLWLWLVLVPVSAKTVVSIPVVFRSHLTHPPVPPHINVASMLRCTC